MQYCNWVQAVEGEIDQSHVSFLHRQLTSVTGRPSVDRKIINTSSTRALRQSRPAGGGGIGIHYNTSKAGIIGFTRSLAVELGQFNICVNAIARGATITYAVDESMRGGLERLAAQRGTQAHSGAEDLIGTTLFLASSDGDFTTGQTLVVDGRDVML
ncbi:MAG: SDR family oxidoreductase [Chloroflexi bacterium]|nr:SDR family oxidoreductase [Chloroflexota bacterium]